MEKVLKRPLKEVAHSNAKACSKINHEFRHNDYLLNLYDTYKAQARLLKKKEKLEHLRETYLSETLKLQNQIITEACTKYGAREKCVRAILKLDINQPKTISYD